MRHALDRVRLAMRKIIARIDAPFAPGARVRGMQDAVQHRVAQIDVARSHVDLGAQYPRPVRELAGPHAAEQVEVLGDVALAIRAVAARLGQGAAHRPHLVGREIVDISLAGADQMLRPVVELLEIIRGMVEVPAPVEAEPAHVALDRVDIFLLFLGRVGVVETQVAASAIFLRHPEIEADRLGVTDMEIAVGLGREPRHDLFRPPRGKIGLDDVADEVAPRRCRLARHRIPRLDREPNVANPHRPAKPAGKKGRPADRLTSPRP